MYMYMYFNYGMYIQPIGSSPSPVHNPRQEAYQMRMASTSSLVSNQTAASSLKQQLKSGLDDGPTNPQHQRLTLATL